MPSIAQSVKLLEETAEDTVQVTAPILAISLLSAAIFGLIDAGVLLFADTIIADKLRETGLFTESMILLIVAGISAFIALFITIVVEGWLSKRFTLLRSPAIDASGIIIGTILVIAGIRIYNTKYPTPPKKTKQPKKERRD
jgi:hypothetical protein